MTTREKADEAAAEVAPLSDVGPDGDTIEVEGKPESILGVLTGTDDEDVAAQQDRLRQPDPVEVDLTPTGKVHRWFADGEKYLVVSSQYNRIVHDKFRRARRGDVVLLDSDVDGHTAEHLEAGFLQPYED